MRLIPLTLAAVLLGGCLANPSSTSSNAAATSSAAPASTGNSTMGMLAQLPAFLTKLDSMRGTALSVAEKTAVSNVVTQSNSALNGVQNKFLGSVASATGLDAATLGILIPSATQPVSNTALLSGLESKLGGKLNVLQSSGVKAANTLRNNSLDSLKTSLANGVASKVGMDPALITSMLPMLGF